MQYIYSAPLSPYTMGVVSGAMELNAKIGDDARQKLFTLTKIFCSGLRQMGLSILNENYFPVVFLQVGQLGDLKRVAHTLFNRGVIAGLRAYPVVPPDQCGLRFGITALHTREDILNTLQAIGSTFEDLGIQPKVA